MGCFCRLGREVIIHFAELAEGLKGMATTCLAGCVSEVQKAESPVWYVETCGGEGAPRETPSDTRGSRSGKLISGQHDKGPKKGRLR